ncbi:MAG: hypothetical protein ABJB74_15715 [Gemmatimonas sp.]
MKKLGRASALILHVYVSQRFDGRVDDQLPMSPELRPDCLRAPDRHGPPPVTAQTEAL